MSVVTKKYDRPIAWHKIYWPASLEFPNRAIRPLRTAIRKNAEHWLAGECHSFNRAWARSTGATNVPSMKKLTPFASRIYKPNRRHLQRTGVRLHPNPNHTISPLEPHGPSTPPMIRIVVETDRADLARIIKLNLPEGSYLRISELKLPRENCSKPTLLSDEQEFDTAVFTTRQSDVVRLLITGLANKEIGRSLGLSHFTVRNHVSQIFRLLGVSTRKDAILRLKACSLYRDLY